MAENKENVAVFVDGSNFYHPLKENLGTAKISFFKLGLALCENRNLLRVYYYNSPVFQQDGEDRYQKQQRFFSSVRSEPYVTLKLGRLQRKGQTFVEKGVDTQIATDMLTHAFNDVCETIILVSADGDYAYPLEVIKSEGKHVEVAWFERSASFHLKQVCDIFRPLTKQFLKKCQP